MQIYEANFKARLTPRNIVLQEMIRAGLGKNDAPFGG